MINKVIQVHYSFLLVPCTGFLLFMQAFPEASFIHFLTGQSFLTSSCRIKNCTVYQEAEGLPTNQDIRQQRRTLTVVGTRSKVRLSLYPSSPRQVLNLAVERGIHCKGKCFSFPEFIFNPFPPSPFNWTITPGGIQLLIIMTHMCGMWTLKSTLFAAAQMLYVGGKRIKWHTSKNINH